MLPVFDSGGGGLPLVLLHGMSGDRSLWEPFVPLWKDRYRVVSLDLPGHGEAEHMEPGLIAQLRGVRDLIYGLGFNQFAFVGHSMGTLPAILFQSADHEVIASVAVEPSLDVAGFASALGVVDEVPEDDDEFLACAHQSRLP